MIRRRNGSSASSVEAALGHLQERELCALIGLSINVPRIVPGLLAWIGHACDWELNRRAYVDFPLLSPETVIPANEATASITAAMALRARFSQDDIGCASAAVELFDAVIRALGSHERTH